MLDNGHDLDDRNDQKTFIICNISDTTDDRYHLQSYIDEKKIL